MSAPNLEIAIKLVRRVADAHPSESIAWVLREVATLCAQLDGEGKS